MIVLLPLRGWIGDAMATQMGTQAVLLISTQPSTEQQVAPEIIAAHAHKSGAGGHFHAEMAEEVTPVQADCADHLRGDTTASAAAPHCESCTMCQACHTVAIETSLMDSAVFSFSPGVPRFVASRFASADRTLGLKPPIS